MEPNCYFHRLKATSPQFQALIRNPIEVWIETTHEQGKFALKQETNNIWGVELWIACALFAGARFEEMFQFIESERG